MNELNIDILRIPVKSKARRIIGILYILMSVCWLVISIIYYEPVANKATKTFLDLVYIIFFGLAGIIFLIDGYGISISKWFGEAYIRINDIQICVKKGVFSNEWILSWSEIELINITVVGIKFSLTDKSLLELNYDNIDYEYIQLIKQTIKSIAKEKNIKINTPE
jgi:hypothetical protein